MCVFLRQVRVEGLFDRFTYDLAFVTSEGSPRPITLITAPNGYGKSTILRLLDAFYRGDNSALSRVVFREMHLLFSDGLALVISQSGSGSRSEVGPFRLGFRLISSLGDDVADEWVWRTYEQVVMKGQSEHERRPEAHLRLPAYIGKTDKSGQWRDARDGAVLTQEKVDILLARQKDYSQRAGSTAREPDWLARYRSAQSVLYISADRLRQNIETQFDRPSGEPAVATVARHISEEIRVALEHYAEEGRGLEQSFPSRILERLKHPQSGKSPEAAKLFQDIALQERRYQRIGLLAEGETRGIDLEQVDERAFQVLRVYLEDVQRKLATLEPAAERLEILIGTLNSLLIFKYAVASADFGLQLLSDRGQELALDSLSSGEQHLIVLLGSLLFDAKPGALVLLDEPEISFHPEWQERITDVLKRIAESSGNTMVLATHSPTVVAGSWDDVIELADQVGH